MLITYPLLALIIWIIVGRGFYGVNRIAKEIKTRDVKTLKGIDTEKIPNEIKPFINELNSLFERLSDSFEREKRFAADAAHELRTPLAILKTQAQVAQQANDEQVKARAIQYFVNGIDRCTHIVQQLLTMSKMVPEATLDHSTHINLVQVATEIISELVPKAIKKSIEIELINQEKHIMLNANATAIAILLRNLIDNAIRYIPKNGHIRVVVKQNQGSVTCIVEDDGPGIPDEMRERVFERFFRMVGEDTQGSGLGLGIVKKIVDLYHAHIELDAPKMGHGLIVRIHFPKQGKNK
jgi:two-component system, OmpR family, sensor histidine kinase QseC